MSTSTIIYTAQWYQSIIQYNEQRGDDYCALCLLQVEAEQVSHMQLVAGPILAADIGVLS